MPKAIKTGRYRSKLEKKVSLLLGEDWEYEAYKLPYQQPRNYTPDFSKDVADGKVHIEVKGYFRGGDQAKYLAIRDSLREDEELVFVFSNPDKPCRRGTKLTMGRWAERHGFRYYAVGDLDGTL